jgi:hypothetical protein
MDGIGKGLFNHIFCLLVNHHPIFLCHIFTIAHQLNTTEYRHKTVSKLRKSEDLLRLLENVPSKKRLFGKEIWPS